MFFFDDNGAILKIPDSRFFLTCVSREKKMKEGLIETHIHIEYKRLPP